MNFLPDRDQLEDGGLTTSFTNVSAGSILEFWGSMWHKGPGNSSSKDKLTLFATFGATPNAVEELKKEPPVDMH